MAVPSGGPAAGPFLLLLGNFTSPPFSTHPPSLQVFPQAGKTEGKEKDGTVLGKNYRELVGPERHGKGFSVVEVKKKINKE